MNNIDRSYVSYGNVTSVSCTSLLFRANISQIIVVYSCMHIELFAKSDTVAELSCSIWNWNIIFCWYWNAFCKVLQTEYSPWGSWVAWYVSSAWWYWGEFVVYDYRPGTAKTTTATRHCATTTSTTWDRWWRRDKLPCATVQSTYHGTTMLCTVNILYMKNLAISLLIIILPNLKYLSRCHH